MRNPLRLVLVAATLAFALIGATVASAAPVTWDHLDVTLHQDQDGPVLLIAGSLATTATLPADVELSVPASSTLLWIGEILGGDTSLDPALKFTKTTRNGMDVYFVTLTKSRIAQIEVSGPVIASADGVTFDVSLDWTADQAVPGVRLTAVLPSGVQIVKPADGASLQVGEGADAANSYYFKVFDSVKAGAKLDLTFSYTASAAAATGGAASSGSTNRTLLIFLAIFLVVVAVVVAAVAVRIRMSAGASDDEDDEEDGFAHDEGETEAADSDAPSGKKRRGSKGGMIAGGMLVLFVLAGSAVGWQAMKPSVVGDTISQVFAGGDPCATVVIPVAAAEGADPAATGSALFAALKPVSGVKAATFNVRTLSIEVGYCESETSEAELRNALAATGFVAPVVPAAENGS